MSREATSFSRGSLVHGPARSLTEERAILPPSLIETALTVEGACVLRILVAIVPMMYRQTLAEYLSKSRPSAEIRLADPKDLDGEVDLFSPDLIVSHNVDSGGMRAFSLVEILYS